MQIVVKTEVPPRIAECVSIRHFPRSRVEYRSHPLSGETHAAPAPGSATPHAAAPELARVRWYLDCRTTGRMRERGRELLVTVSLLAGTASPALAVSFLPEGRVACSVPAGLVSLGDTTGSGFDDIALPVPGLVACLLNDARPIPSFSAESTVGSAAAPSSVLHADLNLDGLSDLVLAGDASDPELLVFMSLLPGRFVPPQSCTLPAARKTSGGVVA